MVMRVTQRNMYSNVVTQMNYTLSQLMESNIQAASEKRINKPSDDPVGMTRVLGYRSSLDQIEQYASNISQATGWLNLADNTLIQVNTVVTNLKELAEQAATGTLTDENREQISYEARQLFEQLLSLSNTSYQDNSIFAGQKTSAPAYQETLAVMTPADADDANFFDSSRYVETISGELDATVALTFVSDSSVPGTTSPWATARLRPISWPATASTAARPGRPRPSPRTSGASPSAGLRSIFARGRRST